MHVDLLTLCIKFYFELLSIRHIVTNYFAMLLRHVIATNERLTQLITAGQPPFFKPQGPPSLQYQKIMSQLKYTVFLHE